MAATVASANEFEESDVDLEEEVTSLVGMQSHCLWQARIKHVIDGKLHFGVVAAVDKGKTSGKDLFRIKYDDGDIQHCSETKVRRYQIFDESDYQFDLAALAKDVSFADVIFRCNDGLDVLAHVAVLEVRCPPLAKIVHDALKQEREQPATQSADKHIVEINDLTAEILQYIVNFLYCEELPFRGVKETGVPLGINEVFDIVAAVRNLNAPVDTSPMRRLQVLCEDYLASLINIKTVVRILFRSVRDVCKRLQKMCYAFMMRTRPMTNKAFREELCIGLAPHPQALALAMAACAGIKETEEDEEAAEDSHMPCSHLCPDMELLWQQVCTASAESHTERGPGTADCIVQFGDQGMQLRAHRFMLAARSAFFRAALQHKMIEGVSCVVTLGGTQSPPEDAAHTLFRILYTGSIDETKQLRPADALYVLNMIGNEPHLGGFLQIKGLAKIGANLKQRFAASVDSSNAWDLLRLASALSVTDMKSEVLRFIVSNCSDSEVLGADSFNIWCPAYASSDRGHDEHDIADASSGSKTCVKRRRTTSSSLVDIPWSAEKESAIHREVLQALCRHMQQPVNEKKTKIKRSKKT